MSKGFKKIDISGKIYGYLTAIKFCKNFKRGKRHIYTWEFKCICGNIIEREKVDVLKGGISSCGCKTKEMMSNKRKKDFGEAAKNSLYKTYKTKAIERNLQFELSKEEFFILTKQNCYYCNSNPSNVKKSKIGYYIYSGIDRVNNDIGYIKNNIVPCCIICNSLKWAVSVNIIKKAYNFLMENNNGLS